MSINTKIGLLAMWIAVAMFEYFIITECGAFGIFEPRLEMCKP